MLFLPPGRPFFPLSICQLLLILPRQKKPPRSQSPRSLRSGPHTALRYPFATPASVTVPWPLFPPRRHQAPAGPHLTEGPRPGQGDGEAPLLSLLSPRAPVRGPGSPRQASEGGAEAGRGRPRVAGEGAPRGPGWEEQREGGAPGGRRGRLRNQRGSPQNRRRRGWESGAAGVGGKDTEAGVWTERGRKWGCRGGA